MILFGPKSCVCVALVGLGVLGCGGGAPQAVPVVSWNASSLTDAAFQQYDKNANGTLEKTEFSPGITALLKTADADQDGALSRDEFEKRLAKHLNLGAGLQSIAGVVTRNGVPVAGARVTLEPEKFMQDAVKSATAKTDAQGNFELRMDGQTLPGAQPGIYLIRVTSGDDDKSPPIPLRYNAETELGTEIGGDLTSLLLLELKS